VNPGVNNQYKNPNPDEWAAKWEAESREIYSLREKLVAVCGIKPGMSVADIGAGTGLFTRLFAVAVGNEGKVYAVDIADKFVKYIGKTCEAAGLKNVVGVVCTEDSAKLPPDSIDLAYICDVYHHFEFPYKTMASIHQALRKDGRVVLVDFRREEGVSAEWIVKHVRAGQDVFNREIESCGFKLVEEPVELKKALKENYCIIFQKVERAIDKPANVPLPPERVNYGRPFESPTRPALIPLPPGVVEPEGWLRDWCMAATDGYTGHMDEVDQAFKQAWATDYKMTGDRLYWPNGGWPYEGGGYWFDGLARLGYVMHDASLINQAKTRLGVVVNNMNENSILFLWWLNKNNPEDLKAAQGVNYGEPEWPIWASGLLGRALAGYYAGSGDPRALRALESAYSDSNVWATAEGWGIANIWPAYQTWLWTGNKKIEQGLTGFFNTSGDETKRQSSQRYRRSPKDQSGSEGADHGVHFCESTAAWSLGYLWTGNRKFLDAALGWHLMIERDCMQPHGVPVFDESYGPTGAFRATETCDVAGYMWCQTLLLGISGEGRLADRIERAFFNAAPATVSRDFKTQHVYFQTPNRMADKSLPAAGQNTFQAKHQPLCCTAALNRILPNFVMHMWMATYDNGLAAVQYGPCRISALAGDGVRVRIDCRTDYPFNESIEMTVKPEKPTAFPLSLRIPAWCKKPAVSVNGIPIDATGDARRFVRIDRPWIDGDIIRLQFPMSVEVSNGTDKNIKPAAPYATVSYGPLLFALAIPDTVDANTPDRAARWNFALNIHGGSAESGLTVERGTMPAKWDWPLESPLKLCADAVSFDWQPANGAALPTAPVVGTGEATKITLIPYGCTKFRVSMFPVTARALRPPGPAKMDQPRIAP